MSEKRLIEVEVDSQESGLTFVRLNGRGQWLAVDRDNLAAATRATPSAECAQGRAQRAQELRGWALLGIPADPKDGEEKEWCARAIESINARAALLALLGCEEEKKDVE